MTDQPITHRSEEVTIGITEILENSQKSGVKCEWRARSSYDQANNQYLGFTTWWLFEWSDLKETGVTGLSGHITVTSPEGWFPPHTIAVNMTETTKQFAMNVFFGTRNEMCSLVFEYTLFPRRSSIQEAKVDEVFYDEMFQQSEVNDTVLLVDGKKLYVNNGFLSTHSEFFRALFSSNFKEGKMNEIPIKDITFEDFGLLMSTIYPETVYPNDNTVEELLELADRFIIRAVIGHVEYHLLHNSNINSEKMMWLADRYQMPKLLEKCIGEINTAEKFKEMGSSPEYEKLSEPAKAKLLDRLKQIL